MVPRGLEPRTLRLLAVRFSQLSYETPDVVVYHTQYPREANTCDRCFHIGNGPKTAIGPYLDNRPPAPVAKGAALGTSHFLHKATSKKKRVF